MPNSSFVVVCTGCGQPLRIPTDRRGDQARCPRCKATFPAGEATPAPSASRSFRGRLLNRRAFAAALGLAGGAAAAGAWWYLTGDSAGPDSPLDAGPSPAGASDPFFTDEPLLPEMAPVVSSVPVPSFPGAFAIWGAIGRDWDGNLWFGVSAHGGPEQSAHLFEYDPDTAQVTDRGDVLTELRRAGIAQPGEQQPKIHSRIVQGGDGHLYFTTMDEPRSGEVGEHAPPWGSHLWRLRLPQRHWEHLLSVPEGLIALAGAGRYVVALGFPDHLVLQYDCQTGRTRQTKVGSFEGHVSRNLLADSRGHVYVPRLKYFRKDRAKSTLVELDSSLREVGENPLPHYQEGEAAQSHGIIAFQQMADGGLVFTTHLGRLFRLAVTARGAARLEDLGWFHPAGRAYAPSLYSFSGRRYLFGTARREFDGSPNFEWICRDLDNKTGKALPLHLPRVRGAAPGDADLYGCQTRDWLGDVYLAGGAYLGRKTRDPVLLRVSLNPGVPAGKG